MSSCEKTGNSNWVIKEEALNLAREGRLHAIIVHMKNGHMFLRPEVGSNPFQLASASMEMYEEVLC